MAPQLRLHIAAMTSLTAMNSTIGSESLASQKLLIGMLLRERLFGTWVGQTMRSHKNLKPVSAGVDRWLPLAALAGNNLISASRLSPVQREICGSRKEASHFTAIRGCRKSASMNLAHILINAVLLMRCAQRLQAVKLPHIAGDGRSLRWRFVRLSSHRLSWDAKFILRSR